MAGIWVEPMNFQFYCNDHQYGWSINEDGISRGCPQCLRDEGIYECEYCGESCDELFEIDDADASVGYRNRQEVCKRCLENPRMYEDRYAARCDRDYERFKEEGF